MFRFFPKVLLLLPLFLAACDDAYVITRVDNTVQMNSSRLVAMHGADGIMTEIHGAPFPDLNANQVATALTVPAGEAIEINRFNAVAAGEWDLHNSDRLVLIFNGSDHPNAPLDCKRKEEAKTLTPVHTGFKVFAVFCSGEKWMAHGHLEALKVSSDNPDEFSRLMRLLMQNILRHTDDERR